MSNLLLFKFNYLNNIHYFAYHSQHKRVNELHEFKNLDENYKENRKKFTTKNFACIFQACKNIGKGTRNKKI